MIVACSLVTTVLTLYNGGPYPTETSQVICRANQWTGFYMIGTSVMKELNNQVIVKNIIQ